MRCNAMQCGAIESLPRIKAHCGTGMVPRDAMWFVIPHHHFLVCFSLLSRTALHQALLLLQVGFQPLDGAQNVFTDLQDFNCWFTYEPISLIIDLIILIRSASTLVLGKKAASRRPWIQQEKAFLRSHFSQHIGLCTLPGKSQCEEAKRLCPLLASREWHHIKFAVRTLHPIKPRRNTK